MRNEISFILNADRPEHENAIKERRNEGSKRDLVPRVSDEVSKQPRTELRTLQRKGDDYDGEDNASYCDHGSRNVGKDRTCAFRTTGPDKPQGAHKLCARRLIDADGNERQGRREEGHQRRHKPEAGM